MIRFKLTIEYKGTEYSGWQNQPDKTTVQGEVEKAVSKACGEQITVFASGRTDAGVHAYGQVVHFDSNTTIPVQSLPNAINCKLPESISIVNAEVVDEEFHARYNAKSKTYLYKMYVSQYLSPTRKDNYHHIKGSIDIDTMIEATKYFLGTHDFAAFSRKSEVVNTIRTITDIKLWSVADEIYIRVSGDGFLYNMVRIMAGTLINIGKYKKKPEDILNIINSKDRTKAGKKLSASGLYLVKVEY